MLASSGWPSSPSGSQGLVAALSVVHEGPIFALSYSVTSDSLPPHGLAICQASLYIGLGRIYWSGLPFLTSGIFPTQGEPASPALGDRCLATACATCGMEGDKRIHDINEFRWFCKGWQKK